MISEEAVEAAFRELPDGAGVYVNSDDLRTILEAAAPYMLAQAWDEGEQAGAMNHAGEEYPEVEDITNPYRSQA